jgi:hypothetical protein
MDAMAFGGTGKYVPCCRGTFAAVLDGALVWKKDFRGNRYLFLTHYRKKTARVSSPG